MGLAPTTSTTMQMALGDALAVALLTRRGFTAGRFPAASTRAASWARRLRRVRELMHEGDAMPLGPPDMPMDRALLVMTEKRFGCLGVRGDDGRLAGIVTDGDLRRAMGPDLLSRRLGEIMTAVAAHHRPRRARRRGAARDERARTPDHRPVRRRRRPAARSASCTSTTCCARGWHERAPASTTVTDAPARCQAGRRGGGPHPPPADATPPGAPAPDHHPDQVRAAGAGPGAAGQHRAVAGVRPRQGTSARGVPARQQRDRRRRS